MSFLSYSKRALAKRDNLFPAVSLCLLAAVALPATAAAAEDRVAEEVRQILVDQARRTGLLNPVAEAAIVGSRPALPCSRPLRVEPLDTRYPSRMRFASVCPGTEGGRQEFIARAELSAEVVVAATALPPGRPISPSDLALERRDIGATPDAFSDPEAAIGQTSRRSLRAGQVLQKPMLAAPLLVRRGDSVRILARSGPVEVSSAGEALEAGHGDDVIKVRNAGTGKVIRARVTASGTVEPVDMPMSMPPQSPD